MSKSYNITTSSSGTSGGSVPGQGSNEDDGGPAEATGAGDPSNDADNTDRDIKCPRATGTHCEERIHHIYGHKDNGALTEMYGPYSEYEAENPEVRDEANTTPKTRKIRAAQQDATNDKIDLFDGLDSEFTNIDYKLTMPQVEKKFKNLNDDMKKRIKDRVDKAVKDKIEKAVQEAMAKAEAELKTRVNNESDFGALNRKRKLSERELESRNNFFTRWVKEDPHEVMD